jgi:thiazole synthase
MSQGIETRDREPQEASTDPQDDVLVVGGHRFSSRLLVGTGKYASNEEMNECLEVSGCEVVTVAVRRAHLDDPGKSLAKHLDREKYTLLPNTAGCYTAEDACRYARLGRELLETDLVKLEVLGDEKTLLPDPTATLEATATLVAEGFTVLTYTSDDPIQARHLAEAGAASVMPAGSPIGSGQGILNPNNIRIILETIDTPVIVDAGVGTASDVAIAMELGVEGVLLNSGIALARDPVRMARAMKNALDAGREAYLAGRIERKLYANASSPVEGMVDGTGQS